MEIDNKLVDYLALLSRLHLSEEEKKVLGPQIKDIVQYVEKLRELDVSNVPAVDHIQDMKNVTRDDEVRPSFRREDILRNAPSTDGTFFEVPKII
jgi:aspartyl-tRNA(Asn)/glutamyl-tRNA(Gln) amidotransferase subunit C